MYTPWELEGVGGGARCPFWKGCPKGFGKVGINKNMSIENISMLPLRLNGRK